MSVDKGETTLRIYFSVTAEDYPACADVGKRFAFVAYRIGEQSELLRRNLPLQTRGGLLCLSDRDAPPVENPGELCAAVLRECSRRGFTGAVLDFEGETGTQNSKQEKTDVSSGRNAGGTRRKDLCALAGLLDRRLRETGRTLYVPQIYADAAPEAVMLICTAVSGGNFREYLEEEIGRRGAARCALDVQRLRMDFTLPAPTGEGKPLDAAEFARLSEGKAVYFSPDLCARYFTATRFHAAQNGRAQSGEAHFILFDDADTLNQKIRIGEDLGIKTAFFQWPEVQDIAGELRLDEAPSHP